MVFWQHDSAVVDAGAQIGDGTKVWHFTHVCAGARVGADCSLGQGVFIGNDVVIGDRVRRYSSLRGTAARGLATLVKTMLGPQNTSSSSVTAS
jgi:acyl-[acyl carrier protein]--UDP-N-acetylglucosamine O-acyltransferase